MNTNTNTIWEMPDLSQMDKTTGEGRTEKDFEAHLMLLEKVISVGQRTGWSKKKMAERIDMPQGSFSQWFSGKYKGRYDGQNEIVSNFLDSLVDVEAIEFKVPASPKFVDLQMSRELRDLMTAAQVMGTTVIGTYAAGMTKTFTAKQYLKTNPHCWMATMTPYTKTVHGALQTVAAAVGLPSVGGGQIVSSIGNKVSNSNAPTLLIIDESQNLIDDAVNQLRHFADDYGCGVAFLGNEAFYGRFRSDWSRGSKYAQLSSRIFKRLRKTKPDVSDIKKFIKAHGIENAEQVKFLTGVGLKPGALRQVDMTIRLAKMTAAGNERALDLNDLKRAWTNRDVEL